MTAQVVTPGERLGLAGEFFASTGTCEIGDHIFATVVGTTTVSKSADGDLDIIQVIPTSKKNTKASIPDVSAIVTGKVLRVNQRQATLAIMVVGDAPTTDNFQGIIRVQDVRATERDKIQIYNCFRPGDIVRAEVISLGDARSYYLSTAKNELGVILATSVAGHTMVPISWEQMVCPVTKAVENRKCAKPVAIGETTQQ
ncbi:Exosome complex component CSL4 [Podochytrium sp. JEL0797]|nr:Exosome complex component CSL4 [Podochytrium sp. JEL0797]